MKKIIVLLFIILVNNVCAQDIEKNINSAGDCKFNHQAGKYFEFDGASIYYEEIENRGKPVLLFLHGGFGNIEGLNTITPLFCNDFHIIGVDSRGHGKSTLGAVNLTYERLQLDVEALLNHLQIHNVNIIGHSDGGIVAYRMAIANKIHVDKVITTGATWSLADAELAEEIVSGMTVEKCKEIFAKNFEFYQNHNPEPDFDKFATLCIAMWIDKTNSGYPQNEVAKIQAPVLIIRGNDDDFLTLESAVELSKKINNSLLLNIPFASHSAFKSHPQIFELITNQFLNEKQKYKPGNKS
jgi:pimeloyl-ACP methyl ester carboxylesterase